jgi:hypothetical protein
MALAKLQETNVREEVLSIIDKLEQGDPMRRGRYHNWRQQALDK